MGTCMSKNNNNDNHTKNEFPAPEMSLKPNDITPQGPPAEYFQRRRLSVSQSAHVAEVDENDRGLVNLTADSVLNLFPNRRRFSISGVPAHAMQKGFDNKEERAEGHKCDISDYGVGYCCRKGLKPESPNQDDFFILEVEDWGLYGVFDGHGPFGHDISNFVQQNLPRLLVQNPFFNIDPKKALKEAFIAMHDLIDETSRNRTGRFDAIMSGSTGTVILHRQKDNKLFVAHVGDSRAVLAKRTGSTVGQPATIGNLKLVAKDLSIDHKPELPHEQSRIVASGGQVRKMPHDIPFRVFVKDRPVPGLAMSRAFGDTLAHSVGVSCVPDVSEYDVVEGEDMFAVMCSDGVWEFISSQESIEIIREVALSNYRKQKDINVDDVKWELQEACSELAVTAWKRWINEEHNVVDDITCIVLKLFHQPPAHLSTMRNRNSQSSGVHAAAGGFSSNQRPTAAAAVNMSVPSKNVHSMSYGASHSYQQQQPHMSGGPIHPDLLPAGFSDDEDSDSDLKRR
eukprot:GDKJ01028458.1.p1 GENE.GDKJ01028458.1~~GDKJ01028458.1.p1  ORF type:complete len:511 (+),score=134.45 GDKJ01028458.1:86-1618(+)